MGMENGRIAANIARKFKYVYDNYKIRRPLISKIKHWGGKNDKNL